MIARGAWTVGFLIMELLACTVHAQVPYIIGKWELNTQKSQLPGPTPLMDVRRYFLTDDGFLVGLVISIDSEGRPGFLQFTARTDGMDYPEYDVDRLSKLQSAGEETPLSYSELQVDERTIRWFDKYDGQVYARGTRNVSEDGRTMTIVAELSMAEGWEDFTIVYERVSDD